MHCAIIRFVSNRKTFSWLYILVACERALTSINTSGSYSRSQTAVQLEIIYQQLALGLPYFLLLYKLILIHFSHKNSELKLENVEIAAILSLTLIIY